MRGKKGEDYESQADDRITPAYAGKNEFPPAFTNVSRDHPRLCGEKLMIDLSVSWVRGSPPPMRGKSVTASKAEEKRRITPAYAGKKSCKAVS